MQHAVWQLNTLSAALALLHASAARTCWPPQGYPGVADAHPLITIDGPLGKNDPARAALAAHLADTCAQQAAEMDGAGYVWQLVGAAKEWIDQHLPADLGSRRAGVEAAGAADAGALGGGAKAAGADGDAAAVAGGAAAAAVPWWEQEEVDFELIGRATAEAAAAHWRSWAVADESSPFGAGADNDAAAGSSSSEQSAGGGLAAATGLEGSRGRW